MAIFKKTKAYMLENIAIAPKGQTAGYNPSLFVVERKNDDRKYPLSPNKTKIYIDKVK